MTSNPENWRFRVSPDGNGFAVWEPGNEPWFLPESHMRGIFASTSDMAVYRSDWVEFAPAAPDSTPLVALLREMDASQRETDEGGGREVAWYYFRDRVEAALGLPLGALDTETEAA